MDDDEEEDSDDQISVIHPSQTHNRYLSDIEPVSVRSEHGRRHKSMDLNERHRLIHSMPSNSSTSDTEEDYLHNANNKIFGSLRRHSRQPQCNKYHKGRYQLAQRQSIEEDEDEDDDLLNEGDKSLRIISDNHSSDDSIVVSIQRKKLK